MVAKHGNRIYSQTSKCNICEPNNLIEDDCIYKILTHQKPKCPLVKTKQAFQVKEITKGLILVDTTEKTVVRDSCGNSRIISEATMIEVGNCTVKIRNFTFSGQLKVISQGEYLIPIYSKPLPTANLTTDDEDNTTILRIQNLEKLSEIQLSNHVQKQVTFGGVTLLVVMFVCFFSIYLYKKNCIKLRGTENIEPPQLLRAEQTQDPTVDTSITTDKSENKKLRFTTTPRFELLKHQTRTLDT